MARSVTAIIALFVFSAATLALEVLLTRILSYSVHTLLLYAALGSALLGFGAAGSLVMMRPAWLEPERLGPALAWSALATSLSTLIGYALFMRITPWLGAIDALSFGAALLLMLPFMAAGTVITLALSARVERVAVAYAANLIGSGAGCMLPILLLGPFDASHVLGLLALFMCLPAWLWMRSADIPLASSLGATLVLTCALSIYGVVDAARVFPLAPEPAPLGQVSMIRDYASAHGIGMHRRYDGSSSVGRIEIFSFDHVPGGATPYPFMFYAQDSSAGSTLVHWDGRSRSQALPGAARSEVSRLCDDTIYGSAYFRPRPNVLVIGLGGAPDLLCALYHEAKRVDVVEINPRTVEAIRGPFAEFLGHAAQRPAVHMHVRDGRSFVHGTSGEHAPADGYDLIQLSGVDTKQNLASGALTLSENHLYTQEAFRDDLQRLRSEGVLMIIRFGEPEALRLANTAIAALRDLDAPHPERHVAVVKNGVLYGVIVRRSELDEQDAHALVAHFELPQFRGIDAFFAQLYDLPFDRPVSIEHVPGGPSSPIFTRFFADVVSGQHRFATSYRYNIAPTSDDRPFFFDVFPRDSFTRWLSAPHVITLRQVLATLCFGSLLLVVIPLVARRRELPGRALIVPALYFASIGFAYLFIEVWLLRRLSMYLGHETFGLGVVLATLLVASGVGAALGPKLVPQPRMLALIAGVTIAVLLMLTNWQLDAWIEQSWGQPIVMRGLVAIAIVTPLGVCMGLCMPAGLRVTGERFVNAVPLCVGINGFASVLATIAVLPLSMWFGYRGILIVGTALYALSSALAPMFARPTDTRRDTTRDSTR